MSFLALDTQLRTGNVSPVRSQSPLADGQTLPGGEVLCILAGKQAGWLGLEMGLIGSEIAADSKLNLKILRLTEPIGQERGGEGMERDWSPKGLWGGDGCMKAALEKELVERGDLC